MGGDWKNECESRNVFVGYNHWTRYQEGWIWKDLLGISVKSLLQSSLCGRSFGVHPRASTKTAPWKAWRSCGSFREPSNNLPRCLGCSKNSCTNSSLLPITWNLYDPSSWCLAHTDPIAVIQHTRHEPTETDSRQITRIFLILTGEICTPMQESSWGMGWRKQE